MKYYLFILTIILSACGKSNNPLPTYPIDGTTCMIETIEACGTTYQACVNGKMYRCLNITNKPPMSH